jgi:hypothetical protein
MAHPQTIRFAINHTENKYYGAALADQLSGSALTQCSPKFFFPADWVAEKARGHVEIASFAVKYCDDSATLAAISRRDKRLAVMKALAKNSHLLDEDYAVMLERAGARDFSYEVAQSRRGVVTAAAAAAAAAAPPVVAPVVIPVLRLGEVFNKINEGASGPELLVTLLQEECARGESAAIESYLQDTYVLEGPTSGVWAQAPTTPVAALAAYGDGMKRVLSRFLGILDKAESQRTPLGLDIVTLLVESNTTPDNLRNKRLPREMFVSEAVDVLLNTEGWDAFLSRQILSEAQFAAYVAGGLKTSWRTPFLHLHGSHERLESVLSAMKEHEVRTTIQSSEWSRALECISSVDDPLIFEIVLHGDDDVVSRYISGELTISREGLELAVTPSLENLMTLYRKDSDRFGNITYKVKHGKLPDEYRMILIENIPGLAWKVIDYDEIGDKIYQRLMALGLTEDQLVEHIDSLQSHSLSDVIASITEPSET